jgi:rare lipoprotein A
MARIHHGLTLNPIWAVLTVVFAVVFSLMWSGAGVSASVGDTPRREHKRVQTGYATYLAPSFHGQESANGQPFDQRKLIAAHRTLPFGTRVRVTNLENGRSVEVRIIDRGPYGQNFREGTIIDVSRAAARRLRMIEDGQVRVRVRVLKLGDGERVNDT